MPKRKDGRYSKQIYIGKDSAGKRKYKTVYASTKKEAERLAAEYKAAIGRGLDPFAGTKTVKDLLDNLLAVKKAQGVGASQQYCIKNHSDHLRPLWPAPADKVRTGDIQTVLNKLSDDGLSHKTLKEITGTIRAAYRLAIPEIVQYNPADRVVVPAGKPSKARSWLDEERQAWVRDTPHRAQLAAMLMMYSGLRRGEATALTWADVDLKAGTITVNKSWDFKSKKVKPPKTEAGNRVVHIPQILVEFLKEQRKADPLSVLVLHSTRGERMSDTVWAHMWESYMRALNAKYAFDGANVFATREKDEVGRERGSLPIVIKTFTPHELRHTFCTLLYYAGVDAVTARDQMGHSDVRVTLSIYTHLDKAFKARNMDALNRYIQETQNSMQVICKSNT